jgi:hypothetical protein
VAEAQEAAKIPMCRSAQLLPYYEGAGLSMGRDYVNVVIRNRSATSCRLRGLPRIRQFDDHGKQISGGISGGCRDVPSREPCGDLILNPGQRAAFELNMSDGGGLDNPICAKRLILDSPSGTKTWPALTIEGFLSCADIEPQFEISADQEFTQSSAALEYHTTSAVEIDPYTRISDQFPRGVPSGGWSLSLNDSDFVQNHGSGPYQRGYDPPFTLILLNQNDSLIVPAIATWCDGSVTIELRGPDGKLLPRTAPPCQAPRDAADEPIEAISLSSTHSLALSLYLYDLGYDLSRPGEYKIKVRWQLLRCAIAADVEESCSVGTESAAGPVTVESNEVAFIVRK